MGGTTRVSRYSYRLGRSVKAVCIFIVNMRVQTELKEILCQGLQIEKVRTAGVLEDR